MITKYFTTVSVKFNPLVAACKFPYFSLVRSIVGNSRLTTCPAKPARVFLANIPPQQRGSLKLSQKVLDSSSTEEPSITVTFSTYSFTISATTSSPTLSLSPR